MTIPSPMFGNAKTFKRSLGQPNLFHPRSKIRFNNSTRKNRANEYNTTSQRYSNLVQSRRPIANLSKPYYPSVSLTPKEAKVSANIQQEYNSYKDMRNAVTRNSRLNTKSKQRIHEHFLHIFGQNENNSEPYTLYFNPRLYTPRKV